MKKIILSLALLASLAIACQDDNDTFITPVNHNLQVRYGTDYGNLAAANTAITLTNLEDGKIYTVTSNTTGEAAVTVLPGTYNITASLTLTPETYLAFSGQTVEDDITFNASTRNVLITASTTDSTKLTLVTGRVGGLILKQIYYAGSDTKLGASYRDQFFEIYNNSNETLYLDGLCFAQLKGNATTPSVIPAYALPDGQYDWRKSIGQTKGEASNTDYIYADEVLRIPGTGNQYALASGKSTIVAATALNHKAPLVAQDANGGTITYEVPEPARTIDLSRAPFECYYRDYLIAMGSKYLPSDVDNPNSTNMSIVFKSYAGQDLILDPLGRDAFAIFYADDATLASWSSLPLPSITTIITTTDKFLQIPNDAVLDAVEIQNTDPAKAMPKRVADVLDAGEIANSGGQYSSQSVIRKISKTIGNRVIYQDTNNSTADFVELQIPQVVID